MNLLIFEKHPEKAENMEHTGRRKAWAFRNARRMTMDRRES
jgi:hypothetical protein